MTKLYTLLLAAIVHLGFLPANAQKTITDPNVVTRAIKDEIIGVVVSSAIDVYLSQGSQTAVAVSASDYRYVDNIHTEVLDNILYISYKNAGNVGWGPKILRAYVSAPVFSLIKASGACNVMVDGQLKSNDLEISMGGSSDFRGSVEVQNLKILCSGSSDVRIAGSAVNLKATVSGSSDIKGFDLAVDYCDLEASGASDIQITANKELKVKASGASDVHYRGAATVREISASGAAGVKRKS